jgi:2'-5' RNA ligase
MGMNKKVFIHGWLTRLVEGHYGGIWRIGKNKTLANEVRVDKHLLGIDDRRGLTVIIKLDKATAAKILEVSKQLQAIEPGLYIYPESDLHVTLIDFISCKSGLVLDNATKQAFGRVCDEVFSRHGRFLIEFKGLCASDTAVFVKGFSSEINRVRSAVRDACRAKGLKIEERYLMQTAHCTIARYLRHLDFPRDFVRSIERGNSPSCSLNVAKLQYVEYDWYNKAANTRIIKEYILT